MVQAILDGSKTQTRRVVKNINIEENNQGTFNYKAKGYAGNNVPKQDLICDFLGIGSLSKYNIGDVLWVRETFTNSEEYPFIFYKADADDVSIKWKPSIFMPKKACRLFLQVKSVRVERLQDITEEDAIAEGIKPSEDFAGLYFLYGSTKNYGRITRTDYVEPIKSFHSLWLSINGPTSWVKNPWVWVIEFEKIEKPKNFI